MTWQPTKLPTGPVQRSETAIRGVNCPICKSGTGQPCSSKECGTYDVDDIDMR